MPHPQNKPYGEWLSPISAATVAQGARPLSQPRIDGDSIFWLEGRATEGGRSTLMRLADGRSAECTSAPFNLRTRVHEYGGGAYLAQDGMLVFSHFIDNQLYLQTGDTGDAPPRKLTQGSRWRYADFIRDPQHGRLISIREDHTDSSLQPCNTICAIAQDGSGDETILAQGSDFYAAPRLSPDGKRLAWLSWDHPRMPWQGSQLWLADVAPDGKLGPACKIAGSASEAVCQPEWSPDGVLHFVSDRSGWWNIYRCGADEITCAHAASAEFGAPHWVFGNAMYGFISKDHILCTYIENGVSRLARLDIASGVLHAIDTGYTDISALRVGAGFAVFIGGSPSTPAEIVRFDLASGGVEVLARSIASLPAPGYLSIPASISYPSNGRTAHAFHYAPRNADCAAPAGDKPPLIVIGHGGPTGMASSTLKLAVQYWTSRGFAVLDVNYGGSSGFGRAYRDALQGQWGVVDVEDCVNGARFLAERGLADGERLVIRGGSAGGFTTLCALAFHDVFKAGASYYGVSDLKGLDQDSHKFESHYNDYLIAPPPESEALYKLRSPSNHLDKLKRPMIFFQGLDDKVVPPPQSEVIVEALKSRGVPVAYLPFAGEGHGFRKAENLQRSLEAELYFYGKVFGFSLAEDIAPVQIENM